MTKDEALKLALEAFEAIPEEIEGWIPDKCTDAVIAIKEALAQPEQKPVGYVIVKDHGKVNILDFDFDLDVAEQLSEGKYPAYTTPPKRTWVGLTNDELTDLFYNTNLGQQSAVAQAIALLKERNT